MDPDAVPRFHPARYIPFALRERVDQELKRLQEEGTIEPVDISEWAATIVALLKSDMFVFAVTSVLQSTQLQNWTVMQFWELTTCSPDLV